MQKSKNTQPDLKIVTRPQQAFLQEKRRDRYEAGRRYEWPHSASSLVFWGPLHHSSRPPPCLSSAICSPGTGTIPSKNKTVCCFQIISCPAYRREYTTVLSMMLTDKPTLPHFSPRGSFCHPNTTAMQSLLLKPWKSFNPALELFKRLDWASVVYFL